EERTVEVLAVHVVELGLAGVGERPVQPGAGVVDQVVEALAAEGPLQRRLDRASEVGEAAGLAHVELQRDRLRARCFDLDHRPVRLPPVLAVGEDAADPRSREMDRRAPSQTPAAAGDDCDACWRHAQYVAPLRPMNNHPFPGWTVYDS